jgi:putative ABC transport system ATP-binding protein
VSIEISDLKKSYQQGSAKLDILKGLSFSLFDGEIIAIVGPSGSGKSTLLSLLGALDRPDSGQIKMFGHSIENMNEQEMTQFRGENIGIVFQQFHLMDHMTALENVMLPLEIQSLKNKMSFEHIEQRASALLSDLGLGDRLNHSPRELSGGECQRVAIARALVTQPKLLLADEPSGNLDVATGEKVMDLFLNVAKKHHVTTIIVTHSPELAQKCQRVLRMSAGNLVSA